MNDSVKSIIENAISDAEERLQQDRERLKHIESDADGLRAAIARRVKKIADLEEALA